MARAKDGEFPFTPRQDEVLALIAVGLSDKEIAFRLGVSPGTIRTHLKRLFRTHHWRSRTEAAAAWMKQRRSRPTES